MLPRQRTPFYEKPLSPYTIPPNESIKRKATLPPPTVRKKRPSSNKICVKRRATNAQDLELDVALKVGLEVELLALALASAALLEHSLAAGFLGVLVVRLRLDAGLVVRVEAQHDGAVLEGVNLAGNRAHLRLRPGGAHDALDLLRFFVKRKNRAAITQKREPSRF